MSKLIALGQKVKGIYAPEAHGVFDTPIPGVAFFWGTEEVECEPLLYEAGVVIVIQGKKVGYLEGDVFHYDPDHYLVLSVPLPFECSAYCTEESPLLGLFIEIDLAQLHEVVAVAARHDLLPAGNSASVTRGVEPVSLDREMRNVTERLLECLCSPLDTEVLGRSLVKEVIYRALQGRHGPSLYMLTQQDTHLARVSKALTRIRRDYAESLTVELLAKEAGMSTSVFHRAFRRVTGSTPLQYLKKIRLHQARALISHPSSRVNQVAREVGYESSTQFSREFKRYFNLTPSEAKAGTKIRK